MTDTDPGKPGAGGNPAGNTETGGADCAEFARTLLSWYDECGRRLPWREDPSPYHVWISEIMLQQTRVEAVKGYYARFLARFPDLRALAGADEDAVLKCWEGLGYYSRARNLKRCASQILELYDGQMPETAAELRKLAGIGPYTSAAIASIAFQEAVPAIDGNLLRVFARLALCREEITSPAARAAAERFYRERMPAERPGDFNQALMDLGALVCLPREGAVCMRDPAACPVRSFCGAFSRKACGSLPVVPAKKKREIDRRTVLVIRDDDRVLLRRRPGRGLLAGLFEFPNYDGWLSESEALEKAEMLGIEPLHIRPLPPAKHIFTHLEWHMRGYELLTGSFPDGPDGPDRCFFASRGTLARTCALPSAFTAFVPDTF